MPPRRVGVSAPILAALVMLTVAGCTGTPGPVDTPIPNRTTTVSNPDNTTSPVPRDDPQDLYEETVADFPHELPDGYPFPASMPEANSWRGMAGDAAAYWWWGCSTLESAWADVAALDTETADAKFAAVITATNAGSPGLDGWETAILDSRNLPHGPTMGTSGICRDWLASVETE